MSIGRRRWLGLAGGLIVLRAAGAQARGHRVVWFSNTTAPDGEMFLDEFRAGMRELGYAEGRNLSLIARWGEDSAERVARIIAEIAADPPDLVVTQGPTVLALRRAGVAVPAVFAFSGDPVEAGFVQSLARPGGGFTGMSFLTLELVGKRIELLKSFLPSLTRVAALANPQHAGDRAERRASQDAANALGLELQYFESRNAGEVEPALAAIGRSGCQAAVMFPFATIMARRERIAQWSAERRIPTASGWAQFAEGGNLLSYGPNLRSSFRRLSVFAHRILRGAHPADIPVELPATVELVVNAAAARRLGLSIPPAVRLLADRVIE